MNRTDRQRAAGLRRDIVSMLEHGTRGHLASALSLVEILMVLYDDVLSFRAEDPGWPNRDRLIVSKGHGCMAQYALLADKAFFPRSEFERFCKPEGILGGHPEHPKVPGVEASTGALGHGLSIGVGMALAARHDDRPSRVFVVLGDGECNEGSIWEGAMCAAKHRLERLTVLVDYNKMQSYSSTHEVLELEPFAGKWESFGFACREIDGHAPGELRDALGSLPLEPGKPSCLICHTVKGKGIPFVEGDLSWHHVNRPKPEQIAALYDGIGEAE